MQEYEDLVYNNGTNIFIRLGGLYYKRVIAVGFLPIDESALPADIPWSTMPEPMREVYSKQLPGQG